MKDRFGSEVKIGDTVATDVFIGPWLYAKVTRLPENDDSICEVQFNHIKYDHEDDYESLFSENTILCTEEDCVVYTVAATINGKPADCQLEIMARSFAEAECILQDIIEHP